MATSSIDSKVMIWETLNEGSKIFKVNVPLYNSKIKVLIGFQK